MESELFKFAFLGTRDQWYEKLDSLAALALPEDWTYRVPRDGALNKRTPILENYVLHTFRRLAYEYDQAKNVSARSSIVCFSGDKCCFNTGLFTKTYENIYAGFVRNKTPNKEPWYWQCFSDNSDPFFREFNSLPKRAQYFGNISELIYDTGAELRVNTAHILQKPDNRGRLPDILKNSSNPTIILNGAIQLAKKKVEANYKAAVPQFYENQICFLLPLCIVTTEQADLSLAVRRHDGYYTGHTCLTLDMAYNNARLIAYPNSDWLKP